MTIYSPERFSPTGPIEHSLQVTIFDGSREYSARVLDLSRGGARLATDASLERGLHVLLRMHLPDPAGRILSVSAETRWRRQLARVEEYELGVRFVFEDDSQRRRITELIDRYRSENPSRVLPFERREDGDDSPADDERRRDPRIPVP